jgi:tetratricopeptide (TPR) repeat protein
MATKGKSKKSKSSSKPAHKKPVPAHAKPAGKSKIRATAKPVRHTKRAVVREARAAELKKAGAAPKAPEPSRLLRETKSTTAALGLLEKAIKFIYHKEFKKARIELKSLMESHPAEQEILARARTYLQICDREDASHKKPVIANDQLYTLGVMQHNQGNYDGAISYFRQFLEKNSDSDHIYYSLAASYAMKGDLPEAVRNLQKAIELNEENRVYAKNDSDFMPLHGVKEFGDLVGWNQPTSGG